MKNISPNSNPPGLISEGGLIHEKSTLQRVDFRKIGAFWVALLRRRRADAAATPRRRRGGTKRVDLMSVVDANQPSPG